MDDFLHNLRSGKLKQSDRGRSHSDYKGPQRRVSNERRRTDYYAKVTGEHFGLVKDAIESLAGQQKRIADALVANENAQTRIAEALETIAAKLDGQQADKDSSAAEHPTAADVSTAAPESDLEWAASGTKLTDEDRPKLMHIIATLRNDGLSWEKIARHMIEKSVPTVSGKGTWRGSAVKKFWDTHA
jgi:glutathione S-transferase